MEKRKRRAFSAAYKTEIVDLVRASGKSIGAVARDLGLTETAVRAWVRQAEVFGVAVAGILAVVRMMETVTVYVATNAATRR